MSNRKPHPENGRSYAERMKDKYGHLSDEELRETGMSEFCIKEVVRNLKT